MDINSISTAICTSGYLLMITLLGDLIGDRNIYLIMGINIALNFANIDWYYQGREEFGYICRRNVIVKVISLIALVCLVKSQNDAPLYALVLVLGQGLNYMLNIVHLRRSIVMKRYRLQLSRHIRSIVLLFAATAAIEVYTLADTTMLNIFSTKEVVGYYSISTRIIGAIKAFIVAIAAVFLPRLSLHLANGDNDEFRSLANKGLLIIVSLSVPAAIGLVVVSEDLIPLLFGADFFPAVQTTCILSLSIITVALSNYCGYQVLVSLKKEKVIAVSTFAGAALNVVLNLLLIPLLWQNGAAIASISTEALVAVIQVVFVWRIGILAIRPKDVLLVVVSATAMALCLLVVNGLVVGVWPIARIAIDVLLGGLIYFALLRLSGNQLAIEITAMVKKGFRFSRSRG